MVEYIVTIKGRHKRQKDGRKTMVVPSRRNEIFSWRKQGGFFIRYFDRWALADGSDVPLTIVPTVVELQTGTDPGFYTNPYHFVNTFTGITPAPAIREVVNYNGAFPPLVSYGDVDYS